MKSKTFTFTIKKKDYEVFFAEDGGVEIYETKDPRYTGFIFDERKKLNLFINALTDIALKMSEEEEDIES